MDATAFLTALVIRASGKGPGFYCGDHMPENDAEGVAVKALDRELRGHTGPCCWCGQPTGWFRTTPERAAAQERYVTEQIEGRRSAI